MRDPKGPEFLRLIQALMASGVEFVIVGGTAAVLHGASTATYDLDVLAPFTLENCERMLQALAPLHPRLSHTPDRRSLNLNARELSRFKNLYLSTDLGRLDLLGALPPVGDAEAILHLAEWLELDGLRVRVLPLELLIQVKAAMGRPKDKMVEVELRALADARKRKG